MSESGKGEGREEEDKESVEVSAGSREDVGWVLFGSCLHFSVDQDRDSIVCYHVLNTPVSGRVKVNNLDE